GPGSRGREGWGGPFQFLRRRRLHRPLGRAYAAAVAVSGVTGLWMGLIAHGGPPSQIGFTLVAVGWLYTLWQAWRCARRRDIESHRVWMLRNYGLTFGAAGVRFCLTGLQWLGMPFDLVYPLSWTAFPACLLAAESLSGIPRPERVRTGSRCGVSPGSCPA
ncbi:MAG: DUF2306 domain-containing protein, partial [Candidatus Eremiobacterota bacterium]